MGGALSINNGLVCPKTRSMIVSYGVAPKNRVHRCWESICPLPSMGNHASIETEVAD